MSTEPITQAFHPEYDLPPAGAFLEMDGVRVEWVDGHAWWQVTRGPDAGKIAYPFSDEGLAVARLWAASQVSS